MRVCILFCLEPRTSLNTQITRSSLRAYRALILACYNNPPFIHQVWSVKLFFISEASPDMCLHNNVHNSKGNKHAAEMESCYSAITNGKFPNPDIAYRKTPYRLPITATIVVGAAKERNVITSTYLRINSNFPLSVVCFEICNFIIKWKQPTLPREETRQWN